MKNHTQMIIVLLSSFFLVSITLVSDQIVKSTSTHKDDIQLEHPDILLISDENRFFNLLGLPLACWYNKTNQFLKPLLLVHNQTLSERQIRFLLTFQSDENILSIGFNPTNYQSDKTMIGSPVTISQHIAESYFHNCSKALLLPYDQTINSYTLSLLASPLASYLHIPILFYDTNQKDQQEIIETLNNIDIKKVILVGGINPSFLQDFCITSLQNITCIQHYLLSIINDQFQTLEYITITNPADSISPDIISENYSMKKTSLEHTALYLFGKKHLLSGSNTYSTHFSIPPGIHKCSIEISMNDITSIFPDESLVPIFLSAELIDPNGKIVAYSHSPGYTKNATYLETLISNLSGKYILNITIFHGFRGGYFSLRGLSNVKTTLRIKHHLQTRSSTHYPLISDLSLNAAYLTSAHGGIIIADEQFSLTDNTYDTISDRHATGPWYDESLHQYNNEKVEYILQRLQKNLSIIDHYELLDEYLNGSSWLALLGDTNMIPMYYYPSNQTHLIERGLPSDNPYSLNHQLSTGRIMSYSTADTSLLIAKTLFYEHLCNINHELDDWHKTFNFIFGEGFGETGGIFHQIPYSNTIEDYGFITNVYGNLRNSRQAVERLKAYSDANFVEYLGHGDWFWFTPSLYGFNNVGQSIGAADIRNWNITHPNVILTAACLMGRVDGIPPMMSVALSFLHAGSIAFIGATRETGKEAGLTILEDHLILDDYSLGEALRGEKQVDKENPTYVVRMLFGDPAFNPYDPLHGFSDQGTPFQ